MGSIKASRSGAGGDGKQARVSETRDPHTTVVAEPRCDRHAGCRRPWQSSGLGLASMVTTRKNKNTTQQPPKSTCKSWATISWRPLISMIQTRPLVPARPVAEVCHNFAPAPTLPPLRPSSSSPRSYPPLAREREERCGLDMCGWSSYGRPVWFAGNAAVKRKQVARVYPRRKAGEKVRSTNKAIELTTDDLVPYFGTPLKNAAYQMGLCPTALKSVCRKLGIHRWPYQQLRNDAPYGFVGDDAIMEPEGEREGEMSSSSSASIASTVAGEQQFYSNSPSEHRNAENCSESLHSLSLDSTSEAGTMLQDYATATDEFQQSKVARMQFLSKSNGDGPVCFGTAKRGKSRERVNDSLEPSMTKHHDGGAIGYMSQGRGRDMREHFNPNLNYACPASYAHYPHYLSMQYHLPMTGVPCGYTVGPHAVSTSRVASASASFKLHSNLKHRTDASSSKPSPHSMDCPDAASTPSVGVPCTRSLRLAETCETPEVELSRAALRLRMGEWSSLAHHMHQTQWQTTPGDGSTMIDGWCCWDPEADGACDMAYLSPCT